LVAYSLAYTTDPNGNVTQTDITDPRSHVERLTFNSSHSRRSRMDDRAGHGADPTRG
jgi:hypothetical protein